MYNIIQGKNHKLFQILKEPIKSCSICFECELTNKIMQKNIRVRYVTTPDQYNAKVIDDAVNNENTHFVSTFKDFVIYDNIEEFFKRFYNNDESTVRIPKIYNRFYKDSEFIPQCQVFSAEGKIMHKNAYEKVRLRNANKEDENKKVLKLFDTKFMNEMNFTKTVEVDIDHLKNKSTRMKESIRLSKLLDSILSKQTISQFEHNELSKSFRNISRISNSSTSNKEIPKAELRLDKNLATKLGFNTNREGCCVIPIDVVKRIQTNSSIVTPKSEIILMAKSRCKYAATLKIEPHDKQNVSTSNKSKRQKSLKKLPNKEEKTIIKTRNHSTRWPPNFLRKKTLKLITLKHPFETIVKKSYTITNMKVNMNRKLAHKPSVTLKSHAFHKNSKTKSQCNILDMITKKENNKIKNDLLTMLQKKSKVKIPVIKRKRGVSKKLLGGCKSLGNLCKKKSKTKTLIMLDTKNI